MTKICEDQFRLDKKVFNPEGGVNYNESEAKNDKLLRNYLSQHPDKAHALRDALNCGQERARVRLITCSKLISAIADMVYKLDSIIAPSYQTGVRITHQFNRDYFPRTYKWKPQGTAVEIVGHSTFYIVTIYRDNCGSGSKEYTVHFKDKKQYDKSKDYIIRQKLDHLMIQSFSHTE